MATVTLPPNVFVMMGGMVPLVTPPFVWGIVMGEVPASLPTCAIVRLVGKALLVQMLYAQVIVVIMVVALPQMSVHVRLAGKVVPVLMLPAQVIVAIMVVALLQMSVHVNMVMKEPLAILRRLATAGETALVEGNVALRVSVSAGMVILPTCIALFVRQVNVGMRSLMSTPRTWWLLVF